MSTKNLIALMLILGGAFILNLWSSQSNLLLAQAQGGNGIPSSPAGYYHILDENGDPIGADLSIGMVGGENPYQIFRTSDGNLLGSGACEEVTAKAYSIHGYQFVNEIWTEISGGLFWQAGSGEWRWVNDTTDQSGTLQPY